MGAWGTAIFSDDLAADVRAEWREGTLEGKESPALTAELAGSYAQAIDDPDESVVFWLALAAAQQEAGRLQDHIRDRALELIGAGGDVARWEGEDLGLAAQRRCVLDALGAKLLGPQAAPKHPHCMETLGIRAGVARPVSVRSSTASPRPGRRWRSVLTSAKSSPEASLANPPAITRTAAS